MIDTGIDTDHQSFDAGAFDYSLAQQASNADKAVSDYNLLDADQISEVLSQLHISGQVSAEQLYVSTKIPLAITMWTRIPISPMTMTGRVSTAPM